MTIGSHLASKLFAFAATTSAGAPVLGAQANAGAQYPLGTRHIMGASNVDVTLCIVNSDGTLATSQETVPSGGARVVQEGGYGELELVFVKNTSGSTIERGAVCSVDISEGVFAVETAGATNPRACVGVALFDIPTAKAGWIVRRGVVKTQVTASVGAAGTVCMVAASGRLDNVTGATVDSYAVLVEDGSAASAGDLLYAYIYG